MEKAQTPKKNNFGVLKLLALPLIGSLLTIGAQQLFSKKNKRTEEAIKIEAEYVKRNFSTLNIIKEWQELSEEYLYKNIQMAYVSEGVTWSSDSIGYQINLPKIAISKELYNKWDSLYTQILNDQKNIDIEVIKSCKDLYSFIKINPFPKNVSEYEIVENSGWNDYEILGRWNTLVKTIRIKINRRLSLVRESNGFE